jgi:8-oxo-dGTP diphosphatase
MVSEHLAISGRVLLFDQNGHILVLKRSDKSRSNPGKWELPGGKPRENESFEASLRREVREETGFEIDIHQSAGTADQEVSGYHVVHVVLIASIKSGGLAISDEHSEFRWVKIPEISGLDLADWFDLYYQIYLRGPVQEQGS